MSITGADNWNVSFCSGDMRSNQGKWMRSSFLMVSCDENVTTFALAGGGGGCKKRSSKAGADEGKKALLVALFTRECICFLFCCVRVGFRFRRGC